MAENQILLTRIWNYVTNLRNCGYKSQISTSKAGK